MKFTTEDRSQYLVITASSFFSGRQALMNPLRPAPQSLPG